MDQKELEIQRALGTVNTYEIRINFPRREEPKGLDQLMTGISPSATRFLDGSNTIFAVEMPSSYIKLLIDTLTKLIQNTTIHNQRYFAWVYVYELIDDKLINVNDFRIDYNESTQR